MPLDPLRRHLHQSGLRQIEAALTELTAQIQNPSISLVDRAVIAGQIRELRAARWLLNRLLQTPRAVRVRDLPGSAGYSGGNAVASGRSRIDRPPATDISRESDATEQGSQAIARAERNSLARATADNALRDVSERSPSLAAVLFDRLSAQFQTSLENRTERPLETDILRADKKRELFYLVLRKLEDLLDELRFSQVQQAQLEEKRSQFLLDLWQATTIDFFGKYYTVPLRGYEVEVVSSMMQDANIIKAEILDKIPGFTELLSHLLFETPLVIDGIAYTAGNPEALLRAEMLLGNLVIQVANAVVQPLLNRFADVETIKQNFYDRRLMPSREIERFRNDLSWKYRMERYFQEPQDIFESQYRLLVLQEQGIRTLSVYAPRRGELEQLSGVRFAVTLALETRDAIAPRLRSAVSILGSGFIYVLTEVIGRSIGLIGRGVLKSLGNSWQDRK